VSSFDGVLDFGDHGGFTKVVFDFFRFELFQKVDQFQTVAISSSFVGKDALAEAVPNTFDQRGGKRFVISPA